MYCSICQTSIADNTKNKCPNCGSVISSHAAKNATIVRPARKPKSPVEINLQVSIDRSGSSSAFAKGIPEICSHTFTALKNAVAKVCLGLWTHSDTDYGEDPVQLLEDGDPDSAMNEIRKITYQGGGDEEETHADQLENLLHVTPWSCSQMRCRNVLLMLANADTKPLKSRMSMEELGKEFKQKGVMLFLVCQETPNLRKIVDNAGGFLVEISNDPNADEIKRVVSTLTATMTATITSGKTVPLSSANNKKAKYQKGDAA
ncbi:hypothetical protein BVX94_02815 [bacterium B17]|nr:hypothetical protein BVX94_02815 [bacterium B17]